MEYETLLKIKDDIDKLQKRGADKVYVGINDVFDVIDNYISYEKEKEKEKENEKEKFTVH